MTDDSSSEDVIVVFLRQPDRRNPDEMRSDPFWEFGSFGITGCHRNNVMNPRKYDEIQGRRLAFVQGGLNEIKLVHITPVLKIRQHELCIEALWDQEVLPLKYESAPLVVNNQGQSDIPGILELLEFVNRPTYVSKFASKFRSRRKPLSGELASAAIQVFNHFRSHVSTTIGSYTDALPYLPPKVDRDRVETYESLKRDRNPQRTGQSLEGLSV